MTRRLSPLHPLPVALFPVLFLAAHNASEVSLRDYGRAAALSLIAAGLICLALRPLMGTWQKAALLTSLALLLFFSYGHVYYWSQEIGNLKHRYLLLSGVVIFLASGWWLRRFKGDLGTLSTAIALAASVLVAISVVRIVRAHLKKPNGAIVVHAASAGPSPMPDARSGPPDIYYLILDGYAREDILRTIYGYDNSGFLAFLRERGFYVADRSHSNYSMTPLSLASSLNMEYVNWVGDVAGRRDSKDVRPLHQLILDNKVMKFLKARGYKFVHFPSGWTLTSRNESADWDVNCGGWLEFDRVLARTTMLQPFGLLDRRIEGEQRTRIRCTFETLTEVQHRIAGPRFVFAHIVLPHPPFLFGPNGESRRGEPELGSNQWKQKSRYRDQVIFCNHEVEELVERILAEAAISPIIVLQGDHGPASTGFENEGEGLIRERMGILNVYHLPQGPDGLYASISPVNTFRLIIDKYFGEHYPFLEDRSYFSQYSHPYEFIDVTETLDGSSNGEKAAPASSPSE
jgi:hypothetical protein